MSSPPPPPPPLSSSVSVPEWFELAGAKSNSRQKAGPHIDLPLVPTLSKSRVENCKLEKQTLRNSDQHSILNLILTPLKHRFVIFFPTLERCRGNPKPVKL